MISHKYRCIFIHIPRTGGSSIDHALAGRDWWEIDGKTKHLTASQAKEKYRAWWDDYFKFALVRDPAERMLSCMKFGGFFAVGVRPGCTFADFLRGYMRRYGHPLTLEHDYRFAENYSNRLALPHAVYRNMLDEEIDYVGRFEALEDSFRHIVAALNIDNLSLGHHEASRFMPKNDPYTEEEIELLESLFREDLGYFDYELPEPGDLPG